MKQNTQKDKKLPVYLAKIRTELILQIHKLDISLQGISDMFSVGITKAGVQQIVEKDKNKLTKAPQASQKG